MIKQALVYSMLFFIVPTVIQFFLEPEIKWVDNIGLSIFAFFAYIFIGMMTRSFKKGDK